MLTQQTPRATNARAELDALTAAYLANGGSIKEVAGFTGVQYQRAEKKTYTPGTRVNQPGLLIGTVRPSVANPIWNRANEIHRALIDNFITQLELADAIGPAISQARLSSYLRGKSNPGPTLAALIELHAERLLTARKAALCQS